MPDENYDAPVEALLTLGAIEFGLDWINYKAKGIEPSHVAQLIRVTTDPSLLAMEDDDRPEGWAPLHARRALGQLRAPEAIEPLLGLLHRLDELDDDGLNEDFIRIVPMIGGATLEPMCKYLANARHGSYARTSIAEAIAKLGLAHAEMRGACIDALARQLELFTDNTIEVNTFLITGLTDLHARDRIGLISRVIRAGKADKTFCGDLAEIRSEMGLLPDPQAAAAIDDAIDSVLPPLHGTTQTPDWMKDFLA